LKINTTGVVPPIFWWLSLAGSVLLLTYGLWRKDIVIVFGQLLGFFIYARNLWFIRQSAQTGEIPPPRTRAGADVNTIDPMVTVPKREETVGVGSLTRGR